MMERKGFVSIKNWIIMKKFFIGILVSLCAFSMSTYAQDYSLTSHNTTPFALNPSLAGAANSIRFGLNYRQQWPALGNQFHTVRASYDQNFYKQMCSAGFAYTYDNMGKGAYQSHEFDLLYAHTIRLKDHYFIRLGVQATLFANFMGDGFEFGDMYNPSTRIVDHETSETLLTDSRVLVDFSAGGSFVIENKLTIGAAVYHIGEPKNGFMDKQENTLERKLVLHVSYFKDLQYQNGLFGRADLSNNYVFANVYYQMQEEFQNFYAGVGLLYSPLIVGVAFKSDLVDVYTPSFMAGLQFGSFQFNYVYDLFTAHKKKNGSWSHEINFVYIIRKHEKYPCPVVYW